MLPLKFQQHSLATIRKKEKNSYKNKEKKPFLFVNIEMILSKTTKPDRQEYKMKLLKR